MRTVNKVTIIGNVSRDPLIKNIDNDKKVALFSVATNRYYTTIEGEKKSESEFHNCVAWGNLADRVEKYLLKGKLVYIEGRLKTRIIEKEDATRTYKTEIVISNLIFLNKKSDFDNVDLDNDKSDEDNRF